MHPLYELGLLMVVSGGFMAQNSTGVFAAVGIGGLLIGTLIGLAGVIQGSSPQAVR